MTITRGKNRFVSVPKNRSGFSLLEILAVIVIVTILAAMIISAFGKTKERGQRAVCLNNLRQVGTAFEQFMADNNGFLPRAGEWKLPTAAYIYDFGNMTRVASLRRLQQRDSVYRCPSIQAATIGLTGSNTENIHGVGWNYYYIEPEEDGHKWSASADNMQYRRHITSIARRSTTIMLGDTSDATEQAKWYYSHYLYPPKIGAGPGSRHNEGMNVIYYDGHADYMTREFYERPEEAYRWMYDPPVSALPK